MLKKKNAYRETKKVVFKKRWKLVTIACISLLLIISVGSPLLIRNLGRLPLESYDEVTVKGDKISLTFAGDGPGWYYSNDSPVVFEGREYRSFSWNEIALFGKDPIGFEGKRYGPDYDGTEGSIYFATQEDFEKHNIFRYINQEGTVITKEVQDFWQLPSAGDYVKIFMYRGENSGGHFDPVEGLASYEKVPDKDAPIWAPDGMVIYYWTSTSADDEYAYDITYSGEVRKIQKTTSQDYRGWRAVRVKK